LIDANRLTDDVTDAAEATLPRSVREQRDSLSAALVIGRQERAAERRSHAEDREQIRRHPISGHALRVLIAALEVDLHALPGADAFERRRVLAPEQIVGR
jgi:phytoene/squalene synthetase